MFQSAPDGELLWSEGRVLSQGKGLCRRAKPPAPGHPVPSCPSRCLEVLQCLTAPARPRGCAHAGPCCSVWESPGSGSTVPAEGINQCSAPVDNVLPTQGLSPAHAPGTSWGWRNWLPCPTASRASRSDTFTAPELLGAGLGANTCSRGTSGTELSGTWFHSLMQ